MAIHSIPQITVNNSTRLFGGYIFSFRNSTSYGGGQSTIKISVVSEDGKYTISPDVLNNTYCQPYEIQVGQSIIFNYYLEAYSFNNSPGGNTLQLEFSDTSSILDKIFVGLYKKHGINSTSDLILVGKEINPCSSDPYSPSPATFYDSCNPCVDARGQQALANYIDCVSKIKHEILDVKFNFTELLGKLRARGFNLIDARDPNPYYLVSHTGTIREVLNNFCADFGWFFFWDNGKIVFKDLRNTIDVTANIESFCPNVLEANTEYSMKNSVKTATITNFSRPGDPAKQYQCKTAKYLECESLKQNTSYSMPLTISPKIDTIGAGLSFYDDDLRHLYYWFVKYQMYDLGNFTAGKKLDRLGFTVKSGPIKMSGFNGSNGKPLDDDPVPQELKNQGATAATINPFDPNVTGLNNAQAANVELIKNNANFYACVQLLDSEHQWKIITNPNNYFFFVGENNEPVYQKFLQEDRDFANFLNRYAVYIPDQNDEFFQEYEFALDDLCGLKYFVNTGNVEYRFLGDSISSPKFYNTSVQGNASGFGTMMGELPFAQFLTIIRDTQSSTTPPNSELQFKLIVAERGQNSFDPQRQPHTDGEPAPINDDNLLRKLSKFIPYAVANKNTDNGRLAARILTGSNIDDTSVGNISIYLGYATNSDDFHLTQQDGYNNLASIGTLFDGAPINKESDPNLQTKKIVYQYPELKCNIIGNHSYGNRTALHANVVNFHTPIGTFKYTEPTDSLVGLVIEKIVTKRRIVEKVESFNYTNLGLGCNYAKLNMNARNISDDTLRVLKKDNEICEFNPVTIKKIHQDFARNLSLNFTKPTISKSFRIAGVDLVGYTPSISNGLISLEIGLDSNNGVYSVYEFGTRLMQLPNPDALNFAKGNDMRLTHGSYTNTVNHYPTLGQPQI